MRLPGGMAERLAGTHPHPRAFLTVSGAHLYGFPSRDSDVDLRGVHLLPLADLVGLRPGEETFDRTWDHDGVEADVVTHDLGKFCGLLLKPNGYVLEQLVSPLVITTSPVHGELLAAVPGLVTSNHAHHYLGFARGQLRLFEKTGELKPLLYTFRVLLTGAHLMRSGEVEADLTRLLADGPAYLPDLVAAKRDAEHGAVPPGAPSRDRLLAGAAALAARLEGERDRSALPEKPSAFEELNALVVRTRLAGG